MTAAILALFLLAIPAAAQQGAINPRVPPPPPPEQPAEAAPTLAPAPEPTPPPETVGIAAGTRIAVVLDTPLSTRISKTGQRVAFRTRDPLPVHETPPAPFGSAHRGGQAGLEIPPETEFVGTVVEAQRPGAFGRAGRLRVRVDRIQLSNGSSAGVVARLDPANGQAGGRVSADNRGKPNVVDLVQWAALGTLVGLQVHGGKGAGYGAAAGTTVGLIILMSKRGPDLYLEPGMPFTVVLDEPVTLPGTGVLAAQQAYARGHASAAPSSSSAAERASDAEPDNSSEPRPKLRRRPKPLPPQP
jgi:hypothetical protein